MMFNKQLAQQKQCQKHVSTPQHYDKFLTKPGKKLAFFLMSVLITPTVEHHLRVKLERKLSVVMEYCLTILKNEQVFAVTYHRKIVRRFFFPFLVVCKVVGLDQTLKHL